MSEYCNIDNIDLRVAGATTLGVSGYCNIDNINLRIVGATVCGHPGCPNIVILII